MSESPGAVADAELRLKEYDGIITFKQTVAPVKPPPQIINRMLGGMLPILLVRLWK